jgi:hypothetical protein
MTVGLLECLILLFCMIRGFSWFSQALAPYPHRIILWQYILPCFVFVVFVFISASAKNMKPNVEPLSFVFSTPFVCPYENIWVYSPFCCSMELVIAYSETIFSFLRRLWNLIFSPSDEVSSVPIIYHLLGMLLAKPNSTPGISTPENGIAKNSPMTNLWCH